MLLMSDRLEAAQNDWYEGHDDQARVGESQALRGRFELLGLVSGGVCVESDVLAQRLERVLDYVGQNLLGFFDHGLGERSERIRFRHLYISLCLLCFCNEI